MNASTAKRVLIYRLGSLGDTVVALPALHLVERAFPNAQRKMLTNVPEHAKAPPAAAILGESGLVHTYLNYPVGTRSARQLARIWLAIRRFRPEVVIYLAAPRGDAAVRRDLNFFRLCGVKRVIGAPLGELGVSGFDPETQLWESEAARILRCLKELGTMDLNDTASWSLRLTEAEEQKGNEALRGTEGHPLMVCGPGTKMQAKDWGRDNWRLLLGRLSAAAPGYALALAGAAEDGPVSDYAARDWSGPVVNLCGKLTPRETAAAMGRAELFVGPDSGPMHLAAAYGVPCAIVFSARDKPGKWFPAGTRNRIVFRRVECAGCLLETCIAEQKKCILSISVDEMLAAALAAWRRESKSGRAGISLRQ